MSVHKDTARIGRVPVCFARRITHFIAVRQVAFALPAAMPKHTTLRRLLCCMRRDERALCTRLTFGHSSAQRMGVRAAGRKPSHELLRTAGEFAAQVWTA